MTESVHLDYGAGLLAYALPQAGADNAQLTMGEAGEVLIVVRKGSEIVKTGIVRQNSSFVRWTDAKQNGPAERKDLALQVK